MTEGLEAKKRALLAQLEMVQYLYFYLLHSIYKKITHQAPVVQKLDSAIHQINHYPVDKYYKNRLRHSIVKLIMAL